MKWRVRILSHVRFQVLLFSYCGDTHGDDDGGGDKGVSSLFWHLTIPWSKERTWGRGQRVMDSYLVSSPD